MKIPMREALADRADRPDELVASGRQIDMIFKPGQKALSLRAAKLWHLLVKSAGVDLAVAKDHRMMLDDLYQSGLGHMTLSERVESLRELQTTLVEVRVASPKVIGRMRIVSEALLSRVERDEDDRGELVWRFGETLRTVFANSDHWAVLSKRAVLAFESRYALRLYEIIALRSGLDHKTSETFPLDELRSRLGVPVGKLTTWSNLRVFALEPAIVEVNQLSGFTVSYEPIKRRRSVAAVTLSWAPKGGRERAATKRELDSSSVGRRARRNQSVEHIVAETTAALKAPGRHVFPENGAIAFGRWAALVQDHVKGRTPDVNMVGAEFAKWCRAKNLPLDSPNIEATFIGFCRQYK